MLLFKHCHFRISYIFNICMLAGGVCGLKYLPLEHRIQESGDAVIDMHMHVGAKQ